MPASPWDMIMQPASTELSHIFASIEKTPPARPKTKLSIALEVISTRGPIETPQIAILVGIPNKRLWGLLKAPREDGRIIPIKDGYRTKWVSSDYKETK